MNRMSFQIAVASALCLTTGASWSQHALTAPLEFVYTSNPGLIAEGGGSVSLLRTSPSYSIVRVNGAMRTEFSLGAVLERSSNTGLSANRADPRLGVDLQWTTPTSQLNLRGSLEDTSSRATEFDSTGAVTVDGTRREVEVGAEWTKELSPVTRLTLSAGRNQVDYETPPLVGFRENSASVAVERTLGDGIQLSVEAGYGALQPDDLTLSPAEKRRSLILDYEAALNELWTVGLGVGRVRINGDASRNINVQRLQLGYQGERVRSTVMLRREAAPSGLSGGYGRTDSLSWTNALVLTSDSRLDISFGRSSSRAEFASVGHVAAIVLRSTLSQFWTMFVGHEFRQAKPANEPTARSRSFSLGMSYSHPDF